VQATYLKGGYVIREPEVRMRCWFGIVGLGDEVSSPRLFEEVLHTGLESSNIIDSNIIGFRSRLLWAVTTSGKTKGAPEGATRIATVSHGVDAVEGVVEASLFIIRG
jgi:hypothetical protein